MNKEVIRFLLFFLIIIGLGIALVYRDSVSGEMLEEGVRRFGEMGPLFFIGVYAIGTRVVFTRVHHDSGGRRHVWPGLGCAL